MELEFSGLGKSYCICRQTDEIGDIQFITTELTGCIAFSGRPKVRTSTSFPFLAPLPVSELRFQSSERKLQFKEQIDTLRIAGLCDLGQRGKKKKNLYPLK